MTVAEPVTLKVTLGRKTFHITYPSKERVLQLMREAATECKGELKPDGKRRFFVCIYCGYDKFSTMRMLSNHRYLRGCSGARNRDGHPVLLLPYPQSFPVRAEMMRRAAKHEDVTARGAQTPSTPPGDIICGLATPDVRTGSRKKRQGIHAASVSVKKEKCCEGDKVPPSRIRTRSTTGTGGHAGEPQYVTACDGHGTPRTPSFTTGKCTHCGLLQKSEAPPNSADPPKENTPGGRSSPEVEAIREGMAEGGVDGVGIGFTGDGRGTDPHAVGGAGAAQEHGAVVEAIIPRSSPSLAERISEIRVWNDNLEENEELLRYWASGLGSPHPFTYHRRGEESFIRRREVLLGMEEAHVAASRGDPAFLSRELTPPVRPEEPPVPGLYHFHRFRDSVTLPWNWKCSSGDEFVRIWKTEVHKDGFRDALMRLVYWWTRMKVSPTCTSFCGPSTSSCKLWPSVYVDLSLSCLRKKTLNSSLSRSCRRMGLSTRPWWKGLLHPSKTWCNAWRTEFRTGTWKVWGCTCSGPLTLKHSNGILWPTTRRCCRGARNKRTRRGLTSD